MARGWESKSVEEQQMERERGHADRRPSAPVDPAVERRRQGLALARARVVADLERARSAAHRQMLEAALADLDRQIAGLGDA